MTRIARTLAVALAALTLLAVPLASADNARVFVGADGVAIEGYDPVAYFTEGEAVEGDPAISHDWGGVTWHFASAEHRDTFAANPERYAPKYGGFCAYAVAKNSPRAADPRIWSIVDGELYLNLSPNVREVWQEDLHEYIAMADRHWRSMDVAPGRTKFSPNTSDR